jgi:predicted ATPase/DNA-binding SARP family transcriptional activator
LEDDEARDQVGVTLTFSVLGPLEVVGVDGSPIDIGGGRERATLLRLLISRGEVVPADVLIEDLWPDEAPANPLGSIQAYVSRLRKRLGPDIIGSRSPGWVIPPAAGELDAAAFEDGAHLTGSALRNGRHEYAAKLATDALSHWRGDAYADVRYESFAQVEIARLETLRIDVLEHRMEAELSLGAGRELVAELEAAVARHPDRERLRGHLMLALYRADRQAEALAVYRDTASHLGEALGIEPSRWLRDLEERILLQDPSLIPEDTVATPTNLSAPLTSFIGRQEVLAAVHDILSEERLVTLSGVAGMGKSRVAYEVASARLDTHPGGVWAIEVPDDASVDELATAAADRIPGGDADLGAPLDDLIVRLRPRDALLVVDGCDRALEAASALITAITRTCPGIRILATSREALRIPGERLFPIGPMPAGGDGANLFRDRARRAGADASVLDDDDRIAEICARLDGLPLVIELVASRMRIMSLDQVEDRVADVIGLAGTRADGGSTLRAAIGWSVDSLHDDTRRVFARLSVFAGRFTLDAAEAVASFDPVPAHAVLDALAMLVDKSLLQVVRSSGRGIDYQQLAVIRAYAAELLDETDGYEAARRMAAFYVGLVGELEGRLVEPDDAGALDWVKAELENIRVALSWSLEHGRGDDALSLAGLLALHWLRAGDWNAGRNWLSRSLASSSGPATTVLGRALELHESISGPVDALVALAAAAQSGGETARAARLLGAARASAASLGVPPPAHFDARRDALKSQLGDAYDELEAQGAALLRAAQLDGTA